MPSCPSGHHSTASDFCDVCGLRLQAYSPPPPPSHRQPPHPRTPPPHRQPPPAPAPRQPTSAPRGGPCPECGTSRAGRFCEECGYDFASQSGTHQRRHSGPGAPPVGVVWRVVELLSEATRTFSVATLMVTHDTEHLGSAKQIWEMRDGRLGAPAPA